MEQKLGIAEKEADVMEHELKAFQKLSRVSVPLFQWLKFEKCLSKLMKTERIASFSQSAYFTVWFFQVQGRHGESEIEERALKLQEVEKEGTAIEKGIEQDGGSKKKKKAKETYDYEKGLNLTRLWLYYFGLKINHG